MTKNITEQDLINNSLNEYLRFSNMLSKTVHDINNPLAVFIGQLSIINLMRERDMLTPEKLDLILSKFASSSETFKDRLENLRGFYKVPINDASYQKLHQIMYSISYYFENEAYNNNINMSLDVGEDIELQIGADKLFIICKNLIQNSIESIVQNSKDGGNLQIKCEDLGQEVRVSIIDSGPGLVCPLEMALELGYTTRTKSNPGFGLAMVSELLKQNKLELTYKKEENCMFSIIYPKK
ncbi:MAG: two-component system C4-dicarboxylate transport sensor histidine kinase DctB [Bacteriovoracaceae bacterium]|jgi:signal transduction histidine kinase